LEKEKEATELKLLEKVSESLENGIPVRVLNLDEVNLDQFTEKY
jgi:hypothetical protein